MSPNTCPPSVRAEQTLRPGVRTALLRNPALPTAAGLGLLTSTSSRDLTELLENPGISTLLAACAERVLAERDVPG